MLSKGTINTASNAIATIVAAAAGLALIPVLIKQLGPELFGIWALISATVALVGIFEFGVTASTGRLVAATRARHDTSGLNAVMSTAAPIFLALSILALVMCLFAAEAFVWFYGLVGDRASDAYYALLISGVGLAVYFQNNIFSCVLWGYEKFVFINTVESLVLLGRTAFVVAYIDQHSTLTTLAWITATSNIAGFVLYVILCWIAEPRLRLRPRYACREHLRQLLQFGWRTFVIALLRTSTNQLGIVIVGRALGANAVSTFYVARQLVTYCSTFISVVTQVASVRAVVLHFSEDIEKQRALLMEGGRYATALSFLFLGGFLSLGSAFIEIWQGGRQPDAYPILVILMLGELFPLTQVVTYAIIVGMGKHGRIIYLYAAELLFIVAASYFQSKDNGLAGICIGFAVAAALSRGLIIMLLGCRLLDVGVIHYTSRVLLPIVAPALVCIGMAYHLFSLLAPRSLFELTLAGCALTLLFVIVVGSFFIATRSKIG